MIETPALPPGAWGRGQACGSGTGGSACTRILLLVELSMAQAQLSAEVDAAPDQGTGSFVEPSVPLGRPPFPPVSSLTGQTGEAAGLSDASDPLQLQSTGLAASGRQRLQWEHGEVAAGICVPRVEGKCLSWPLGKGGGASRYGL